MILIITCIAIVILTFVLACMIKRMAKQRASASRWLTMIVAAIIGGGLGYFLNSIPIRVGMETKVYGIPTPFLFLIKEGGQWTDFVIPKEIMLCCLVVNVAAFALVGAVSSWRLVVKKMNTQNQVLVDTAHKFADHQR